MAIKGILSEYSLGEIFKILEQGSKTGLLTLNPNSDPNETHKNYYIWFRQGRIVGAADRKDSLGLTTLIAQRNWLSTIIVQTASENSPIDLPLGICLKSKNLLQAEQLKILFYVQVMQQVCNLFELSDAQFEFDPHQLLPMAEMTGLSSPGTEITLAGLRALKDWSMLAEKLPDLSSALMSNTQGEPPLNLNKLEYQVWQYCNKRIALSTTAQEMKLSTNQIRQIAFRLIAVNLAEELPMVALINNGQDEPNSFDSASSVDEEKTITKEVSQSLLKNLISFLQKKS